MDSTNTPNGPYTPQPLDSGGFTLPVDVLELRERLAENAHETWALGRLREGWQWGPKRDDPKKLHPCLVPYAELPDSEKQYDRDTAESSLLLLLVLGWQLVPPAP